MNCAKPNWLPWHAWGGSGLGVLICLLSLSFPASGQDVSVLEEIAQVRYLSPEQAQLPYPVQLQGVVTYFDKEWQSFFIEDETAGIYVQAPDVSRVELGHLVEVNGFTDPGDFAPVVISSEFHILGKAALPRAKEISYGDLATGQWDSKRVQLDGRIRSITEISGRLQIDLAKGTSRARVLIPWEKEAPVHLLGATVKARGICAVRFRPSRELAGFQLLVPNLDHLEVVELPAADPFAMPPRTIRNLMRSKPQELFYRRIKVKGVVTHQQLGSGLYIRDETGAIYVQTPELDRVATGDEVEAVGYLKVDENRNSLEDAIFRRNRYQGWPKPVVVTPAEMAGGRWDSELVQFRAILSEHVPRADQAIFICRSGDQVFEAILDGKWETPVSVRKGSELQLTGICSSPTGDINTAAFRILLRSPEDVIILRQGPWWTLERIQRVLLLSVLLVLAVVAWLGVLRHRLRLQKELLGRKLKQEAALEERYRELFERANDIIFSHDQDGNFTSLNRTGERVTGYTREEFVRMNLLDLVTPESASAIQELNSGMMTHLEGKTYELELKAKGGRNLILEVSSRLHCENGKPLDIQSIARDITERKQAESELEEIRQQLKNYAEDLEKRVEERTQTLGKTVQSLESFCYSIAHDLRAPLRAMNGFSSALLEDYGKQLGSVGHDYAERIAFAAAQMDQLIEDLLAFASLSHKDFSFEMVDLNGQLETVLRDLAPEIKAHKAEIEVPPSLPPVWGSPTLVQQLLSNLLSNAIKFVAPGVAPRIIIQANLTGSIVQIFVKDNGIGIERQHQQRIFQIFERLHPTETYSGTGIGLAIVQKAAERMRGRVGVESEPGQGSCFSVELPAAPRPATSPTSTPLSHELIAH
jgi:PAS domain S-box-containing protein